MSPFATYLVSNLVLVAALALIVFLVTRIWRNPHLAYGLWLLVLLKAVTPPLVEIPLPAFADSPPTGGEIHGTAIATTDVPAGESLATNPVSITPAGGLAEPAESRFSVGALMISLWVTGSLVLGVLALRRYRRLRALLRTAEPANPSLASELSALAERFELPTTPELLISAARVSPFVTTGVGKQTIVLPAQLIEGLESEEVRTILAHELAHVNRGDRWSRLFELLVIGTCWWNPVVWWASRQLRRATEACCDAMVIWALPEGRRSYGSALLRTVEFTSEADAVTPLAGAAFGEPLFKQRIETIMKKKTQHQTTNPVRAFVLLIGITALPLSATFADEAKDAPKDPFTNAVSDSANANDAADTKNLPSLWRTLSFTIDAADAEVRFDEITGKSKFASLETLRQYLKSNVVLFSMVEANYVGREHLPGELKKLAESLAPNEVVVIGHKNNFQALERKVDFEAIATQKKAKKRRAAQLRLLQLDVRAAQIKAEAAKSKIALLTEAYKEGRINAAELSRARTDAELAQIEVERAEVAVELHQLENDSSLSR